MRVARGMGEALASLRIVLTIVMITLPGVALANFEFTIKNGANNPPLEFWTTATNYRCFQSPNQELDDRIGVLSGGSSKTINLSVHGHGDCQLYGKVEIEWYAPGQKGSRSRINHIVLEYKKYGESVSIREHGPGELKAIGRLTKYGRKWTFETTPTPIRVGKFEGHWTLVCRMPSCDRSYTTGRVTTRTESTELSSETTNQITNSLNAGVDFGGISAGGSHETSRTTTTGQSFASEFQRSSNTEATVSLPLDLYEAAKVNGVFRWEMTACAEASGYCGDAKSHRITVRTEHQACTKRDNPGKPKHMPDSIEAQNSCQTGF